MDLQRPSEAEQKGPFPARNSGRLRLRLLAAAVKIFWLRGWQNHR